MNCVVRSMGILPVGVVTKPFVFEGKTRMRNAEAGIEKLRSEVDSLVIIPNERLLMIVDKRTTFTEAFNKADDVLRQGVQGITDLITFNGLVNLDFNDVRTIMINKGIAHMGVGVGKGEDKAIEAVNQAISSPLLETRIDGATGILINVTGGEDLSLLEVTEAADIVKEAADPEANIIFGAVIDPSLKDEIKITVIATGFDEDLRDDDSSKKPIKEEAKEEVAKEDPIEEKEEPEDQLEIPPFLRNRYK